MRRLLITLGVLLAGYSHAHAWTHGLHTPVLYLQNDGQSFGSWSTPLTVPAATDAALGTIVASATSGTLTVTDCGALSSLGTAATLVASGVTTGTSIALGKSCSVGATFALVEPGVPVSSQTFTSRSIPVYAGGHAEPPVAVWDGGMPPYTEVSGVTYVCVNAGAFGNDVSEVDFYLNGPNQPYAVTTQDGLHCPSGLNEYAAIVDTSLLTAGRNEIRACIKQTIGPGMCLESASLPLTTTTSFERPTGSMVLVAQASHTTLYVDGTSGNNSNNCTSSGTACLTICGAIAKAGTNGDVGGYDIKYEEYATGYAVTGCTSHPAANQYMTIEPDTGVTTATKIVNQDSNGFFTQRVHLKNTTWSIPYTATAKNGIASKYATNPILWIDGGAYTGPSAMLEQATVHALTLDGGTYFTNGFVASNVGQVCKQCSAMVRVTAHDVGEHFAVDPGELLNDNIYNLTPNYPGTGTVCAASPHTITNISDETFMVPGATIGVGTTGSSSLAQTTIVSVDSATQVTVVGSNTVGSGCLNNQLVNSLFHPDVDIMQTPTADGGLVDTLVATSSINSQGFYIKDTAGGVTISNILAKNSHWNNSANTNRTNLTMHDTNSPTYGENILMLNVQFGDAALPGGTNQLSTGLFVNSQILNSSGNPALNNSGAITGWSIINSPTLHSAQ